MLFTFAFRRFAHSPPVALAPASSCTTTAFGSSCTCPPVSLLGDGSAAAAAAAAAVATAAAEADAVVSLVSLVLLAWEDIITELQPTVFKIPV